MNSKGDLVPVLVPPDGCGLDRPADPQVRKSDQPSPVLGPTQLFDWLMVDVRIAKKISSESRLYEICQSLGERGACGVIESTLVIDLLEIKAEDRRFLLDKDNWPNAGEPLHALHSKEI